MTKVELLNQALDRLRQRYDRTMRLEDADLLWDLIIEAMCERLCTGESVNLRRFGTFKYEITQKRRLHHVQTREVQEYGGNPRIRFTASKLLLDKIQASSIQRQG